jgi:hypothetical protein
LAVDNHELGLLWSRDQAMSWRIRDNQVWSVSGWLQQPRFEAYCLAKTPLSVPKSAKVPISEYVVARCDPLEKLRADLSGKTLPPVYSDYVPIASNRGLLFVLEANRTFTEWEYSFRTILPSRERQGGVWTVRRTFSAEFFEPFHVYLKENAVFAITRSGGLYVSRDAEDGAKVRRFLKRDIDKVLVTIEDAQADEVHLFTSRDCLSLREPDKQIPFEFSWRTDNQDEVARALKHAIEFLEDK